MSTGSEIRSRLSASRVFLNFVGAGYKSEVVPIDSDTLCRHAEVNPYLYHVTVEASLESIFADGLRPGSEFGGRLHHGFHATREGHVYLGHRDTVPVVTVSGPRVTLCVDLRTLDADCFNPDEDEVQQSFLGGPEPWLPRNHRPPTRRSKRDHEEAGQDGDLAQWADTTPGFDAPGVTARSLAAGRIAYRGTIPPEAIEIADLPSIAPAYFVSGLIRVFDDLSGSPDAPQLDYYLTEVKRATVLGESIIESARGIVTGAFDPVEIPGSDAADKLRDELSAEGRALMNDGRHDAGAVLLEACSLADKVGEFEPELGWGATKDDCVEVAGAAVDVVAAIAEQYDLDQAFDVAVRAMVAAES